MCASELSAIVFVQSAANANTLDAKSTQKSQTAKCVLCVFLQRWFT